MARTATNVTPLPKRDPVNFKVARNVRDIMFQRDINQVQLALELGLTESQVSRRLGGKVDWTPGDLETTARVLRVPVGRLFDELPAVGPDRLELPTSSV
jgi:transcriptional regulator with XRE-family HTH domain